MRGAAALAVVAVVAALAALAVVAALAAFTFFPVVPGSPVLAVLPDFPGVDDDTADLLADFRLRLPERLPRPSGGTVRVSEGAIRGILRARPGLFAHSGIAALHHPVSPLGLRSPRRSGHPASLGPGTDNHPCHGVSAPDRPPAVGSGTPVRQTGL
ncbi:hypothetical protein GCM10010284_08870 [Streptomyces rubiginosohelvolus]|nr:hypothetical protein GCM10010284_08870 [Streptomyces rubiginosohelvolus]